MQCRFLGWVLVLQFTHHNVHANRMLDAESILDSQHADDMVISDPQLPVLYHVCFLVFIISHHCVGRYPRDLEVSA